MARPRIGFLGIGWIGRKRMQAILATASVEAVAVADPSPEMTAEALVLAPGAEAVRSLDELLAMGLDGIVIATPSADHAEQSIRALQNGAAVFCQKPLGRNAAEAAAVVAAARAADRLLSVDFSYRLTEGMAAIAPLVREGALGRIQAIDLTFHNAYGPDKPWFYDKALSGGGCVMDLGVHLIDLALWTLDFPEIEAVTASLFAGGRPMASADAVEDLALATLRLTGGVTVRIACSWHLHAGQDAMIEASFYGSEGGATLRNVDGSFVDFATVRMTGTSRQIVTVPPDDWGGRAAAAWALQLAQGVRYDPAIEGLVRVAEAMDRIYDAHQGSI